MNKDRIVRLRDGSIVYIDPDKEFELDENVKYELRYRPGDYVQDLHPEKEYNKWTGTVGQFQPPYDIPKEA